jgi:hypothetical protein
LGERRGDGVGRVAFSLKRRMRRFLACAYCLVPGIGYAFRTEEGPN